jgi:hypothetical protein
MDMAHLGNRQKIILGIMAIAILYAAVDFMLPKKKIAMIDTRRETEELNTFVTTLAAGMGKDSARNLGPLIFSRAERNWTQDPFLEDKSFRAWVQVKKPAKEGAPAPKIEFTYTGYLEMDRKRIAIINGVEYKEGEPLDIKGFVLKSVSPARVLIENQMTGATINILLQE